MDFKVLGRLMKMVFKDYPVHMTVVAVCIVLSAAIGVAPAVYIETVTRYIEEGLLSGWDAVSGKILSTILVMIVLYLASLILTTIHTQLMAHVTQGFLHNTRVRMFSTMQRLPISYFDQNNRGDIMSRYTNDTDTLRQVISQSLPNLLSSGLTVIGVFAMMIYFSVPLMAVVLLGVMAMTWATKRVGGKSATFFVRQQESLGKTEGFIEEMMNGQKVVKVFCHEKAAERDFDVLNEQLFRDSESAHRFANIFGPIMNNIGNLLYVLTAFAGGLLITAGQSVSNLSIQNLVKTGALIAPLSISVVASYLGMCKQFTANVSQVSQQFNAIAMAIAGAGRIFELLEQQPEADEGTDTLVNCREENGVLTECAERTGSWAWKCPRNDGSAELVPLRGDVRFFDVDFAYVPGKTVLHDISLYAKPGQKLAFVGATGAGKTTITNLINRFYDIADGKIRYDGVNINHIKKADLRHSLGIVLQDVNLFTGTVMENIRYGKLDATDEECIAAAKLANAHDFITRLPDGYDTMLTANGANLSQGQRQLLSIARAAVADPPVMILDEATSSIDTRTELLVQRGMDALMKGRTVFVIAHRLSTVQNSDAIMVLDHGRIIERGTHDDLIAQKGTYYQLYTGAFELE
ncbi:MAG: ABC transporter ATP-binding protein [Firmicutes bacterium]|nr:ABC transporter ATP-binding protein [Bacillota bacterium]MDY2808088.1 ABC transporter ATP-binding protein [Oscillospiraceae bacterium]